MSHASCTIHVKGLDCSAEAEVLSAALAKVPGVLGLGFDLFQGTMTVDYSPSEIEPHDLIQIIAQSDMVASLIGTESVTYKAPSGVLWSRWYATALAGLAILAAVIASMFAGPAWLTATFYACAVVAGGVELFPRAIRSVWQLRLDIHVLMGLAVIGALALGQWDEAATLAFLFGVSELLERRSLEPGPCTECGPRPARSGSAPELAEVYKPSRRFHTGYRSGARLQR